MYRGSRSRLFRNKSPLISVSRRRAARTPARAIRPNRRLQPAAGGAIMSRRSLRAVAEGEGGAETRHVSPRQTEHPVFDHLAEVET